MTKFKMEEWMKEYEVVCEGHALSLPHARAIHRTEIEYQKRWIKGRCTEGEVIETQEDDLSWSVMSKLTFNRYFYKGKFTDEPKDSEDVQVLST